MSLVESSQLTDEPLFRAGRSQFSLGPDAFRPGLWRSVQLDSELVLSADIDLRITQSKGESCRLTMVGYALDWRNPEANDQAVLDHVAALSQTFDSCAEETAHLSGRWIMIFQTDVSTVLFQDACGQRQVLYTHPAKNTPMWCASQGLILEEVAGATVSIDAQYFINRQQERDDEYWWPGDETSHEGVAALLPNHALDLRSGIAFRYWPGTYESSKPASVESISEKLVGNVVAASNRFDVALGLSAGWDSRLLLAASRKVIEGITVYTAKSAQMGSNHRDIEIPKLLAANLKFRHQEVHQDRQPATRLGEVMAEHAWKPHLPLLSGLTADYAAFKCKKTAVIGNVSEVARLPYRNQILDNVPLDGSVLAAFVGMAGEPFANSALQRWLNDAKEQSQVEILDLFYWEQRIGRWLAGNCLEYDVAWRDVYLPLNCRSLLCELLTVDESRRGGKNPALYVELIQNLWPEVLEIPVNPENRPSPLRKVEVFVRKIRSALLKRVFQK